MDEPVGYAAIMVVFLDVVFVGVAVAGDFDVHHAGDVFLEIVERAAGDGSAVGEW